MKGDRTVERIFVGVDGGQSATTAMVGDGAGNVLGMAKGGPCNHVSGPAARERFVSAIGGAVAEACERGRLGREWRVFAGGCFGFSGGPADKRTLVEEMFRFEKLTVTHDGLIALAGATAGEAGIIAIAGTGSISFGRNGEGKTARAGGWGYVFGDEGGAFDLVRGALRAGLRMEEGWGPETSLRGRLLEATGAGNMNELLHWFYTPEWPRSRVAKMAAMVDDAALAGDAVARDLLGGSAQSLATIVSAVRRQLFVEGEPVRVAHIGGVFRSGLLRERFRMLTELTEGVTTGPPVYGPAAGALLEAYRESGLRVELKNVPEIEK